MRRPRRALAALVSGGPALVLAAILWAGSDARIGAPHDRAAPPLPPRDESDPLRITVLGTSLTALYDWPAALETRLAACLPAGAAVTTLARPGANVAWGWEQVAAVRRTRPHAVVVEFAINDADALDGLRPARADRLTRDLVAALQDGADPAPAVVLMTMSPAAGPRGWIRPRLQEHYAAYRAIAADAGAGLVDLYPRWMARPGAARGLDADGLHPQPGVVREVLLPVLFPYVARLAGARCSG